MLGQGQLCLAGAGRPPWEPRGVTQLRGGAAVAAARRPGACGGVPRARGDGPGRPCLWTGLLLLVEVAVHRCVLSPHMLGGLYPPFLRSGRALLLNESSEPTCRRGKRVWRSVTKAVRLGCGRARGDQAPEVRLRPRSPSSLAPGSSGERHVVSCLC